MAVNEFKCGDYTLINSGYKNVLYWYNGKETQLLKVFCDTYTNAIHYVRGLARY